MEGNLQDLMELTETSHSRAEFSAQQLADLAGITSRTLHHYDEIGLLLPAMRVGNGRRLYHSNQVVRLCQILWLRGLGFPLEGIRAILKGPASNTTAVLRKQQRLVQQEITRMQGVERSIERAIQHLEGLPMNKQELECILKDSAAPQKAFHEMFDETYGEGSWEKAQTYSDTLSEDQRAEAMRRTMDWNIRFMAAARQGLSPDSDEVQSLVDEGTKLNEGVSLFSGTPKEIFLKGRELNFRRAGFQPCTLEPSAQRFFS